MIEALERVGERVADDLSASDLLALARDRKAAEDQAAAELLEVAARWADLHPPESIHSAAAFTVPGCEHEEPIAGLGCPLVAEFCIAELGAVLGISSTGAKKLIGHALELRHRLPRLWAQVHSGAVPAWRARLVAEATIHTSPALTVEAAGWIDSQVAAVAGRIGTAQLDRLVAETIKRYDLAAPDPAADPEDGYLSVDPRHVTVNRDDVHYAGTLHLEADLDIADALDLDGALAHGAALQKALGSTETLDVRRAKALGDLARTQTALDLFSSSGGRVAGEERAGVSRRGLPAAREVVVHAHFDATIVGEQTVFGPTGRMEEGQRLVLLDQIKAWCGDSRTKVTIKPVIDLQRRAVDPGVRGPRPDPRAGGPPGSHLRVPLVHPTRPPLRRRPHRRVRPRCRSSRGSTSTRPDHDVEPRRAVSLPPPAQDLHRLALPHARARGLRVDESPRPPLPTRWLRHHAGRRTRATRPTLTPPRTPPHHDRRGNRHVTARAAGSRQL